MRYANGRNTYAPHMVRDAIKLFQEVYPDWKPRRDGTLAADRAVWGKHSPMEVEGDWLDDLVEDK